MDPITLVALIAHHTPNLTSRNSILWNFLQTITSYSEEMKQSFVAKLNECRVCFTAAHGLKVPIHKLYSDADKSLARPGRKQATATEDFDVLISYL